MAAQPSAAQEQNGLVTACHAIVAPRRAFESLRRAPTWGWAFLIAMVLGIVGTLLSAPAALHSAAASMAHQMAVNPQYAQLSEAQRRQGAQFALLLIRFGWVFTPFLLLLGALVQTIVMLIFNAAGRGTGKFTTLWACAMNISIPAFGLSLLAGGVTAAFRGAAAYSSPLDSFLAMPSLAWLSPHAAPAAIAFLSGFNPFSIWAFFLTAAAMLIAARVSKPSAYLAGGLILLIPAMLLMWTGSRS